MLDRWSRGRGWIGVLLVTLFASLATAQQASIRVQVDQPGVEISPMLYGVFFEEINRAGEGGLHGEMLQNRSFEDADLPIAWTLHAADGAATMSLDRQSPLNDANPTSLKLEVKQPGARVAVVNEGFKGDRRRGPNEPADRWQARFAEHAARQSHGLNVQQGQRYRLSLHARTDAMGFAGGLLVSLQASDGTPLASATIQRLENEWTKHEVELVASATDTNARLAISPTAAGAVWLDMVSLFPADTFKGRPNGMRRDLAEKIAALQPAFVRFPGGCYVEGDVLANAFHWKDSIGDIARRKGHWNLWGYRVSNGLGFHEYLQFCDDLGAKALFVVNCGMSHVEQRTQQSDDAVGDRYLQDALDALEYANGPATSKWGALRAANGRAEPFNLEYVQIGNENGGRLYDQRYALFHDAIRKHHPTVKIISNNWGGVPRSRPIEILDEHYYDNPSFFLDNADRYDRYDRAGPKIYVGEYAVTRESGAGNLAAAIGEAAFMTGMERNADVVVMASYAPLLVHPSFRAWNPNAIVFDNARVFGTPSYHVQAMFAQHRAARVLPAVVESPSVSTMKHQGLVGVGTWATQAEFRDLRVTAPDGRVLFASDFSTSSDGWQLRGRDWSTRDGSLVQSGNATPAMAFAGDPTWTSYTVTLRARKTGGDEGFLVAFQSDGRRDRNWLNLGGWGNSRHAFEGDGFAGATGGTPGRIETGRWYDVRIEIDDDHARAFLDGVKVVDETRRRQKALYASAGLAANGKDVVLKVVNAADTAMDTAIDLAGIASPEATADAVVLRGDAMGDENSFETPTKIAPQPVTIDIPGPQFRHAFPPRSVTILTLRQR
jgi:alpha-L-arabinofuranosidase